MQSVEYKAVTGDMAEKDLLVKPNVFFPCVIAQGPGFMERIGRSVTIKQITIIGYVFMNQSTQTVLSDLYNNIRYGLAVVPSGYVTFNTLDMWNHMFTDHTSGDPHLALRVLSNTSKIKMILDKKITLMDTYFRSGTGTVYGAYDHKGWRKAIKIKKKMNMKIEWLVGNSTGIYSAVEKNFIYFWYTSDSTTAPHPRIYWTYRIRYVDS